MSSPKWCVSISALLQKPGISICKKFVCVCLYFSISLPSIHMYNTTWFLWSGIKMNFQLDTLCNMICGYVLCSLVLLFLKIYQFQRILLECILTNINWIRPLLCCLPIKKYTTPKCTFLHKMRGASINNSELHSAKGYQFCMFMQIFWPNSW